MRRNSPVPENSSMGCFGVIFSIALCVICPILVIPFFLFDELIATKWNDMGAYNQNEVLYFFYKCLFGFFAAAIPTLCIISLFFPDINEMEDSPFPMLWGITFLEIIVSLYFLLRIIDRKNNWLFYSYRFYF